MTEVRTHLVCILYANGESKCVPVPDDREEKTRLFEAARKRVDIRRVWVCAPEWYGLGEGAPPGDHLFEWPGAGQ